MYCIIERCFVRDADFDGHDLGSKKLPNPEECQKWCQETKECDMFVYATKAFNVKAKQSFCYLKNNMAKRLSRLEESTKPKKGLIAGPKFCQIYDEGEPLFRKN